VQTRNGLLPGVSIAASLCGAFLRTPASANRAVRSGDVRPERECAPVLALIAATAVGAVVQASAAAAERPADLVLLDGRIYTEDAKHSEVAALAVRGDTIVYVGPVAGARRWVGANTRTERLHGRLVLPGLVDAHIHASMISDIDVCDLKSADRSLREISAFAAACIQQYQIPDGEWLSVHQWNYAKGNLPDAEYPTLRVALDKASTTHPIELRGNDGHHNAFNSVALARAKNERGDIIGFSKASLSSDFRELRPFVGVDDRGEPDGTVNEDARLVLNNPDRLLADLPQVMRAPERVMQRLNGSGITAILDPKAPPGLQQFYDTLDQRHQLTVRVLLAQYYIPEQFRDRGGQIDYEAMLNQARGIRGKYERNPLIRANAVKLFADGGLEGNPYANPPTLPNAAVLRPFYQPIFGRDDHGQATVTGYVDTASQTCADARANPARFDAQEAVARFIALNGFHPGQCQISSGRLYHSRADTLEFVRRFHLAGFVLHIHTISNQAVRTSLDAIEAARAADGKALQDALAHVQLADPEDIARIGRDRIFVAFTYSWATVDPEYDLTVIPFIDRVTGNRVETLHRAASYYDANAYPFRAVKQAGGILVAGSDAPVETPDPRPFVNMSYAILRHDPGQPALNPTQSIAIRDVLDAYTINGARAMGREQEFGSLEVGKSADFIVLDRDILALADRGTPERIADARVLTTWFKGQIVYRADQ
jgi:predicted amidohydrolase YtcJ